MMSRVRRWGWRFLHFTMRPRNYWGIGLLLLTLTVQLFLYWLLKSEGEDRFFRAVRNVFVWGILATLIYKELIIGAMLLASDKSKLERCFIWHAQAISLLFIYSFIALHNPPFVQRNAVMLSWMWFNIWVQILVSAAFVLYYLYIERFHPVVRFIRRFGWPGRKHVIDMIRGRQHTNDPGRT